jgi:hypothetical protein
MEAAGQAGADMVTIMEYQDCADALMVLEGMLKERRRVQSTHTHTIITIATITITITITININITINITITITIIRTQVAAEKINEESEHEREMAVTH